MLSYFEYYIIKTQQARKSIVLKLCGYAAAFEAWCLGGGPTTQVGVLGVLGGVEISLALAHCCSIATPTDQSV